MGNSFDSYRQGAGSSLPVGSICQAPYNLTDPAWLPCDGRVVLRATYPKLSACLPSIGTFTATSRTKSATPTSSAIANNGTVWVVTGAVGTNNLYTTTDGITYTAAVTPASCDIRSILHDGVNFVAVGQSGAAHWIYSATGTGTWSVSTGGAAISGGASLQTCTTWAASLGTVGRFCVAGGSANFYTSDDRGVTWTTRAHGLGGNVFHVCWTGQKFIATTGTANTIYTSADGITWAAQPMPFTTTAATAITGSIISDGNGKVLWILPSSSAIATSLNHGATWTVRQMASNGAAIVPSGPVSYTNGHFYINSNSHVSAMSTDLVGWNYPQLPPGSSAIGAGSALSYKSGVYLVNADATTTNAYTLVEDSAYLQLPQAFQSVAGWNNYIPFIKVQ